MRLRAMRMQFSDLACTRMLFVKGSTALNKDAHRYAKLTS